MPSAAPQTRPPAPAPALAFTPAPAPKAPGPLIPLGPVKLDPAKAPPRMPISELRADRAPGMAAQPAPEQSPEQPTDPAATPPAAPEQPLVQLAMEIFNAKIVDVRKKE